MSLDILGFALGQRLKDLLKPAAAPEGSIFYLYGAPAKTRTIYNGVELPELPEWDKETYPYYTLIKNYSNEISIICAPTKFVYGTYASSDGNSYTRVHITVKPGNAVNAIKFPLQNMAWGEPSPLVQDNTNGTANKYIYFNADVLWASYAITNIDDNTTYLSATEPVAVPMSNPAMAVYGGEELPPLPEWDKATYPYAYINISSTGVTNLLMMPREVEYGTYTSGGTQYTRATITFFAGEKSSYASSLLAEGLWGAIQINDVDRTDKTNNSRLYLSNPVWANTDIPNLDTDGIYLAASDPVYVNNANIALADGDGYVMYNGAVLPPLPKWDKVNYPYAYVYAVNDYFLLVTKDRPSVYGAVNIDGEIMYKTYSTYSADESIKHMNSKCENGVWSKPYEVTQNNTVTGDAKFFLWANGDVFWSNFDVINKPDGTIYNAACAPISLVSNEPVAAVYGDLQMPVLPEWDKTAYPYAHMTAVGKLSCMPSPIKYGTYTANSTKYTKVYFEVAPGSVYKFIQFSVENGAWGSPKEVTVDRSTSTSGYYGSFASCIWANTNVPNVDTGNTYLFASDPIHVYEQKE